jgi:SAM-dependent methyltransferase
MRVADIPALFQESNDHQNLYVTDLDLEKEGISYPGDAFSRASSENQGFWALSRLAAIKRVLALSDQKELVEVGAGGGSVCVSLDSEGYSVFAIEPHLSGATEIARNGVNVLCGFLENAKFPNKSVPNFGVFDVIEHLPDPGAMLTEMLRTLDDDGQLYLTVPVGQWLWGSLDEVLGHQLRFSRKGLRQLLEQNGFTPIHEEFLFLCLVPLAWLTRALPYKLRGRRSTVGEISDQLAPSRLVNSISSLILKIEARISQLIPLPYGLSLLVVARKKLDI